MMKVFRNITICALIIINIAVIGLLCFYIYAYNSHVNLERSIKTVVDISLPDVVPISIDNYEITSDGTGISFAKAIGSVAVNIGKYMPDMDGVVDALQSDRDNDLIGSWYFVYDIGYMLADEVGIYADGIRFPVKVILDFSSDGSLLAYVDESSVNDGIDVFVDESMDAVYAFIKSYGISSTEADFLVGITYGGDWGKFIRNNFGDLIQEEISESQRDLKYEVQRDKIYIWKKNRTKDEDNYAVYKISGNTMTITTLPKEFHEMLPEAEAPIELRRY